MKHTITIEFSTDRELTASELDDLLTDTATQVIEPNDDATFTTEFITIQHKAQF